MTRQSWLDFGFFKLTTSKGVGTCLPCALAALSKRDEANLVKKNMLVCVQGPYDNFSVCSLLFWELSLVF